MGGGCSRAGIARTWPEEIHPKGTAVAFEPNEAASLPSQQQQPSPQQQSQAVVAATAPPREPAKSRSWSSDFLRTEAMRWGSARFDGRSRISLKGLRSQPLLSPGRSPPAVDRPPSGQRWPLAAGKDATPRSTQLLQLQSELKQSELKVRELSQRGFTVAPLLDFYMELGTPHLMPHFNPHFSTTRDVVWGAVLPWSSGARCAAATLLQDGWPTMPSHFVAHAWDSGFGDTVAALLAEEFGLSHSSEIRRQLADGGGAAALRRQVLLPLHPLPRGAGGVRNPRRHHRRQKTFWMCVFSTNLHRSLCASSQRPSGTDTVTGRQYGMCPCAGCLRPSPEAAFSEIDKFHLVLHELSNKSSDLKFVLAVDQRSTALSRLWCMLELVEASNLEVPVRMQAGSFVECKSELLPRLRRLEAPELAACRDDSDFLMKRIPNMKKFHSDLRTMLFADPGGLLSGWIVLRFQMWRVWEAWRRVHVTALIDAAKEWAESPAASPARNQMELHFMDDASKWSGRLASTAATSGEFAEPCQDRSSSGAPNDHGERHSLKHWEQHSRAFAAEKRFSSDTLLGPDDLCTLQKSLASQDAGGVFYTEVDPAATVNLNVGGMRFTTVLSTLRSMPHSLLAKMFAGQIPLLVDEEGAYCIDRDGRYFHVILCYLRDRSLPLSLSEAQRLEVMREAKFYGLTALEAGLRGKWSWDERSVAKSLAALETPPEELLPPEGSINLYARLRYGAEYAGNWIVSSPRGLPAVEYEFHQGCVAKDPIHALTKMARAGFQPCDYPPPVPRPQEYYKESWDILLKKELPRSMLCTDSLEDGSF